MEEGVKTNNLTVLRKKQFPNWPLMSSGQAEIGPEVVWAEDGGELLPGEMMLRETGSGERADARGSEAEHSACCRGGEEQRNI